MTSARVLADSFSPDGHRLTTMEVTTHRFVLAEFNTHRVFSRNSASSRAIPVEKQLQKVKENPAWPIEWPCEQPGMQGGSALSLEDEGDAFGLFDDVWYHTIKSIEEYLEQHPNKENRLHKSLINRLLEPFMWHTIIVSSTEWDNFFKQRCSPLAQPEIRAVAEAMRLALEQSDPQFINFGEWHLPLILEDELLLPLETKVKVSAARCARVSYLTHDGKRSIDTDLDLYQKLVSADPPHWSPLEHVATPAFDPEYVIGNFEGWHQLRHVGI